MTTVPLLREATSSDAGAVATLLGELGYPCTREEALARIKVMIADDTMDLVVVDVHGDIRGLYSLDFMFYLPFGRLSCRITSLVVAPAHRQAGIGRLMLKDAESRAMRRGAARVEVTSAEHREEAHTFYRRCGYVDASLRFVKRLGNA
ncbi:MAG TPA: GNAT family N-acetyltransferase [Xanthomonadales bacterium]|nr:GNAT family N-acetyltransferase [Xanthomonadales bacterium]